MNLWNFHCEIMQTCIKLASGNFLVRYEKKNRLKTVYLVLHNNETDLTSKSEQC